MTGAAVERSEPIGVVAGEDRLHDGQHDRFHVGMALVVGLLLPGHVRRGFGRRLDLDVGRGEVVAVIGRSGSGKTTVLKLAAGIVDPTEGTIHRERPAIPRVT